MLKEVDKNFPGYNIEGKNYAMVSLLKTVDGAFQLSVTGPTDKGYTHVFSIYKIALEMFRYHATLPIPIHLSFGESFFKQN